MHMRGGRQTNLRDWFCNIVGVPRWNHQFDLPDKVPDYRKVWGNFVVVAAKAWERNSWQDHFNNSMREMVKILKGAATVLEVGPPSWRCRCLATDLGAIDATSEGFLDMAGIISQCKVFVGTPSAPLVLADAFPWVHRIALHDGVTWDVEHAVTRSPMNHYLCNPTGQQLAEMVVDMLGK